MIRRAQLRDSPGIRALHLRMGFPGNEALFSKIRKFLQEGSPELFVLEYMGRIVGYFSLSYLIDSYNGNLTAMVIYNSSGNSQMRRHMDAVARSYLLRKVRREKCRRIELIFQRPDSQRIFEGRIKRETGQVAIMNLR